MTGSGRALYLLLLESALELVPAEIAGEPSVVKVARRRGKKPEETLLDVSLHYDAMKRLRDREKRGRPDIVHFSLLEALESPLNKSGHLKVFVHTYAGLVIGARPDVRLPKNYNRFVGLMEQLLVAGRVPPGSSDPLLWARELELGELLRSEGLNGLVLLWERGEPVTPLQVIERAVNENMAVGVGGFQHGDFSPKVLGMAKSKYSIYPSPLPAWVVVSRLLAAAEHFFGVLSLCPVNAG